MADVATPAEKLGALVEASDRLQRDFGNWRTPWGEINRYQRLTGDIVQKFDDSAPSVPIPFASAQWGTLASFGAKRYPGTRRYYGTSGNSFVAVVEFGPKVRAVAVSSGGESGNPSWPTAPPAPATSLSADRCPASPHRPRPAGGSVAQRRAYRNRTPWPKGSLTSCPSRRSAAASHGCRGGSPQTYPCSGESPRAWGCSARPHPRASCSC